MGASTMNDHRLIELETKLTYQEEALQVLNEVVARQQKQIEALQALCRDLRDRVAAAGESAPKITPADEVPPHY